MPSCRLESAPIDSAALYAEFRASTGDAGAIVSFTGAARSRDSQGSAVDALVLEAYRGVTLASMEAIVASARTRFAIAHALVVHRHGRIAPGEDIVFVATAAAHRRAAFEAADCMMDRLKSDAVFWKREEGQAGRVWIEPTAADLADNARWGDA